MTLPCDGFPRITSEGIRLLRQGLAGNFEGWERYPTNHPMEVPRSQLRNCAICADPKTMHLYCTAWFGYEFPVLGGTLMAPRVPFDAIDLKEGYIPPACTILLYKEGAWRQCTGILLAVDDRGLGSKQSTVFATIQGTEGIDEDEDEHVVFEVQPCQRTLEGFRWLTATSSAPMTT